MKNLLLTLTVLASSTLLNAQTLTTSYFSRANDVRVTANDTSLNFVYTPASNTAQTWDFSYFQPGNIQSDTVVSALGNTFFPTAEYKTTLLGFDAYVDVTSTREQIVGVVADLLGNQQVVPFSGGPRVIKTAPVNVLTTQNRNYNSGFNLAIATSTIPGLDTLLLGLVANTPFASFIRSIDSIRIAFDSQMTLDPDAFGTAILPQGNYPVVRIKQTEIVDTKIEAYITFTIPFLRPTWFDVTPLLGAQVPGLPLGRDTTQQINFFCDTVRYAIVSVTRNPKVTPEIVQAIQYKYEPVNGLVSPLNLEVSLFPNPTLRTLNVSLGRELEGMTVEIVGLDGRVLIQRSGLSGNQLSLDVPGLAQGIYWCRVKSADGRFNGTSAFQKAE